MVRQLEAPISTGIITSPSHFDREHEEDNLARGSRRRLFKARSTDPSAISIIIIQGAIDGPIGYKYHELLHPGRNAIMAHAFMIQGAIDGPTGNKYHNLFINCYIQGAC